MPMNWDAWNSYTKSGAWDTYQKGIKKRNSDLAWKKRGEDVKLVAEGLPTGFKSGIVGINKELAATAGNFAAGNVRDTKGNLSAVQSTLPNMFKINNPALNSFINKTSDTMNTLIKSNPATAIPSYALDAFSKKAPDVSRVIAGNMGYSDRQQMGGAVKSKIESLTAPMEVQVKDYENRLAQNPSYLTRTLGQTSEGLGQVMLGLGAGALTRNPNVALGVMATSAAGHATDQAYQQTGDLQKAVDYGVASGVKEAATERIFGVIPGFGKGVGDTVVKKVTELIAGKPALKKLVTAAAGAAGEGLEEVISGIADPFIQKATYDPNAKLWTEDSLADLAQQFTVGSLVGLVAGGVQAPLQSKLESHDIRTQVNVLNEYNEMLPADLRQDPLQITTRTSQADVDAYREKVDASRIQHLNNVQNLKEVNTPIQEAELQTKYHAELPAKLADIQANVGEQFGVWNSEDHTPEIKQHIRDTYNVEWDRVSAEVDDTSSPEERLAKAIADGTANEKYAPATISKFLAQKKAKEELTNPTIKYIDPSTKEEVSMPKSDFRTYVDKQMQKKKKARMTDEQFEDFVNGIQQAPNEEIDQYAAKATEQLSRYGVKVVADYNLPNDLDGKYNAVDKTIHINANKVGSTGVASYILAHELTHHAKTQDATLLVDVQDAMVKLGHDTPEARERLAKDYAEVLQPKSETNPNGLTPDEIAAVVQEELTADFFSKMMRNDDVLVQIAQEKPSLLQRIIRYLKETFQYTKQDRQYIRTQRKTIERLQAALQGKPIPASSNVMRVQRPLPVQGTPSSVQAEPPEGVNGSAVPQTPNQVNADAQDTEMYSRARNFDDLLAEWESKQEKYGVKPEGMEPRVESRVGQVPQQIDDDTRVSDFARTLYESEHVPDEWDNEFKRMVLSGQMSYEVKTDDKSKYLAEQTIMKQSLKGATDIWRAKIKGNTRLTKEDIVLAETLLVEAFKRGDFTEAQKLIAEISPAATEMGQGVQAISMLKKLTPQGRMYYSSQLINRMQEDLNQRLGRRAPKLNVPDSIWNNFKNAKTVEDIDNAELALAKHIGPQIPPTVGDRIRAWRYLAMLGNPRTHIRNIVSNTVMSGARMVKNVGAATTEAAVDNTLKAFGHKGIERSKALAFSSPETRAFAKQDFEVMKPALSGGGKTGFEDVMDKYKNNFSPNNPVGKALNFMDKGNSYLLNGEDMLFKRFAYQNSLSSYMTANKLTPEFLQSGTKEANLALSKARNYATQEALKATFQEVSKAASLLNRIERSSTAAELAVGGLMPFKKTPINIMKRGLEYSPLGLIETLGRQTLKLTNGEITAAEYIDRLASGATGTGAFIIGAYAAALGYLNAGGDDKKKEEYFNQMQGEQPYSIRIGDNTYTVDWLTPVSLPLMAGVEMVKYTKEMAEAGQDTNWVTMFNRIVNGVATTVDPMTQLSMLQGINNAIASYDENKIGAMAVSAVESYAGQFVPTIFGQATRTMDDTRRSTYAPKDAAGPFGQMGESFMNRMENKAFQSTKNEPYIDLWGREEKSSPDVVKRALESFVAPYYRKEINKTPVDDEIARLYDQTGLSEILPGTPESSYSTGEGNAQQKYYLKPDEYTTVKRMVGQVSYDTLNSVFQSATYQSMDDTERANVVKDVFKYARNNAKADYAEKKGIDLTIDSIVDKVDAAQATGMDIGQYFTIMESVDTGSITGDKDPETGVPVRKDKNGLLTRKTKVTNFLNTQGLTKAQYEMILENNGYVPDSKKKKK